jgi:hypothetical protein
MLINIKLLKGFKLDSQNGEIGKIEQFYFDDKYWTIRYLAADTGDWLRGRLVLVSPYALVSVNKAEKNIILNLTKKQIEDSPPLDSDKTISRQFEETYFGYYGWPMYWYGSNMWGAYPSIVHDHEKWDKPDQIEKVLDARLRSTNTVSGYHIQAKDGGIGHVDDFIIDDETWAIRYLIIDTVNWWAGKKILISPRWIERIIWDESKVLINLPRNTIRQSPEYTDESMLTRNYEAELHHHYNRQVYWFD